jgi:hypothetical protein
MEKRILGSYFNQLTGTEEQAEFLPGEVCGFTSIRIDDKGTLKKINLLHENHGATVYEIKTMVEWLKVLKNIYYCDKIPPSVELAQIQQAEARLGVTIPMELKQFYSAMNNCEELLQNRDSSGRILTLEELLLNEQERLVFYNDRRVRLAVSLETRQGWELREGERWVSEHELWPFCKFISLEVLSNAIMKMPYQLRGETRVGPAVSLQGARIVEEGLKEVLWKSPYFQDSSYTLFYHIDGHLAKFRTNGFTAEFDFGSNDVRAIGKLKAQNQDFGFW